MLESASFSQIKFLKITTMFTTDLEFLRQAIAVSVSARKNGNHPFGAILVSKSGKVLLSSENSVVTSRDATGHAETNLVRAATQVFPPEVLATSTLYSSCEPCVMCSGAMYWAGIQRLVYALSEASLLEVAGANKDNPTMSLPCREVFARGQKTFEVHGPALESLALEAHLGFWQ
jgi:tRNA(Arg) A34 adenosine deaminase TadA